MSLPQEPQPNFWQRWGAWITTGSFVLAVGYVVFNSGANTERLTTVQRDVSTLREESRETARKQEVLVERAVNEQRSIAEKTAIEIKALNQNNYSQQDAARDRAWYDSRIQDHEARIRSLEQSRQGR
jgi:hypothetical protein